MELKVILKIFLNKNGVLSVTWPHKMLIVTNAVVLVLHSLINKKPYKFNLQTINLIIISMIKIKIIIIKIMITNIKMNK